jgi:hypothetical protein
MERSADIDGLIARMEALLVQLRERGDGNRHFLATYLRTTRAVRDELAAGGFLDRAWVERRTPSWHRTGGAAPTGCWRRSTG